MNEQKDGPKKNELQKIFEKFCMLVSWGEWKNDIKDPKNAGLLSVVPAINKETKGWQVVLVMETKTGTIPLALMLRQNEIDKLIPVASENNSLMEAFYGGLNTHFRNYHENGQYDIQNWDLPVLCPEFDDGMGPFLDEIEEGDLLND